MSDESNKQSTANALYTAANAALRDAHREEFDAILNAKYAEAGLVRKVRKSAEQRAAERAAEAEARAAAKEAQRREKALATAQALAAEFPDLVSVANPVAEAEAVTAEHLTEPAF